MTTLELKTAIEIIKLAGIGMGERLYDYHKTDDEYADHKAALKSETTPSSCLHLYRYYLDTQKSQLKP